MRNPDLMEVNQRKFRIFMSRKAIRLTPFVVEVLNAFGESAALVDEILPDANRKTLSTVAELVDRRCLVATEVQCLLTGCGRSGTGYIARLLCAAGLDIGHETMGRDGISSWMLAVDADRAPWGPLRRHLRFEQILHQTRHPLECISSLQTLRPDSWRYICEHIPCSPREPLLIRCAKYWRFWNLKAESIAAFRYRVEDVEDAWPELQSRLGLSRDKSVIESVPRDVNTRRGNFEKVGWNQLASLDSALCAAVQEQAARYGYRI